MSNRWSGVDTTRAAAGLRAVAGFCCACEKSRGSQESQVFGKFTSCTATPGENELFVYSMPLVQREAHECDPDISERPFPA